MSDDTFPEGWQLGQESWTFHRQFHARTGRTARHGEYSIIRAQIRYRRTEPLGRYHHRLTLPDGTDLVIRGNWHRLHGVEPAGWVPKPPRPAKAAAQPRESTPPSRAPKVAEPPPAQPSRASTLKLSNPEAARALAARLRRLGVPDQAASRAGPP